MVETRRTARFIGQCTVRYENHLFIDTPKTVSKSADIADSIFAEIGRVFCTPSSWLPGAAPRNRGSVPNWRGSGGIWRRRIAATSHGPDPPTLIDSERFRTSP